MCQNHMLERFSNQENLYKIILIDLLQSIYDF